MVHTIDYNWKNFSVNMEKVYVAIKAIDANCLSLSANYFMQVHFTEEPTEESKIAIQAYWDSLTEESIEATSYISKAEIEAKYNELKVDITTKSFDQLSAVQKKMLMNLPITAEELFE